MNDGWLVLLTLLPGTVLAHVWGAHATTSYGLGIIGGFLLAIMAFHNLGRRNPDGLPDLLHQIWSDDRETPRPKDLLG